MTNVVGLHSEETPSAAKPQEGVIEDLRWLLARAETGEIQAISCAFMMHDLSTGYMNNGVTIGHGLVGSVRVMEQALLEDTS